MGSGIKGIIQEWKKFWTWSYIIDYLLTVIFCGLGTLGLMLFAPYTLVPFRLDDPAISFIKRPEMVSNLVATLYCSIPPMVIYLIAQYWFRSWHDLHHAILGTSQALCLVLLVCEVFHKSAGALRPDFLDRCRPDINGVCTGDSGEIAAGRAAFPSGHAGFAFGAYIFLALYLSAKLKTFQRDGYLHEYLLILGCPVFAIWIAITRLTDYRHGLGDIIAGCLIGVVVGVGCYFLHYPWVASAYSHLPKLRSRTSIKEIFLARPQDYKITYEHVKEALEFQEKARVAYFQQVSDNQRLLNEIVRQGEPVRQLLASLLVIHNENQTPQGEVLEPVLVNSALSNVQQFPLQRSLPINSNSPARGALPSSPMNIPLPLLDNLTKEEVDSITESERED